MEGSDCFEFCGMNAGLRTVDYIGWSVARRHRGGLLIESAGIPLAAGTGPDGEMKSTVPLKETGESKVALHRDYSTRSQFVKQLQATCFRNGHGELVLGERALLFVKSGRKDPVFSCRPELHCYSGVCGFSTQKIFENYLKVGFLPSRLWRPLAVRVSGPSLFQQPAKAHRCS